jgi:hypothetical protein
MDSVHHPRVVLRRFQWKTEATEGSALGGSGIVRGTPFEGVRRWRCASGSLTTTMSSSPRNHRTKSPACGDQDRVEPGALCASRAPRNRTDPRCSPWHQARAGRPRGAVYCVGGKGGAEWGTSFVGGRGRARDRASLVGRCAGCP